MHSTAVRHNPCLTAKNTSSSIPPVGMGSKTRRCPPTGSSTTTRSVANRSHALRSATLELPLATSRLVVTDLAVHIRVGRFSELAVFDARLYIRVRRIDEPA